MTLRYAYNTNGTARHRLEDVVGLIAEAGYDGISLTLDHSHLDPMSPAWERNAEAFRKLLDSHKLGAVVETGALFLLDPRRKHEPTLISTTAAERAHRLGFLKRAVDIGAILGAEAMSFWGGRLAPGQDPVQAKAWLREGVASVVDYATSQGVVPAMEPEPDMIVSTVDDYAALAAELPRLQIAMDLGHVMVTGEREPEAAVVEFGPRLGTVHIEDMKRGDHVHLPFGEGDMDVPAVLGALAQVNFKGLVCVELSRDSDRAHTMIGQARRELAAYERQATRAVAA